MPMLYRRKHLLNSNRLGQVSGEVDVETTGDSQVIGNELKWENVEKTLQAVNGGWDLDLLGLGGLEFLVTWVADNDWLARTSNDYDILV